MKTMLDTMVTHDFLEAETAKQNSSLQMIFQKLKLSSSLMNHPQLRRYR